MANHRTGTMIACPVCGTLTYKADHQIEKGAKYCSKKCRYSAPRPYRMLGTYITCVVCGKQKYRKQSEISYGVNKTCSVACRNKLLSGENNYFHNCFPKDIPNRPVQWTPKQRRDWLGPECVRCGSVNDLELDHIIPRGPNTSENAQTLCRSCNQKKAWHEDRLYYESNTQAAKTSPPL